MIFLDDITTLMKVLDESAHSRKAKDSFPHVREPPIQQKIEIWKQHKDNFENQNLLHVKNLIFL